MLLRKKEAELQGGQRGGQNIVLIAGIAFFESLVPRIGKERIKESKPWNQRKAVSK